MMDRADDGSFKAFIFGGCKAANHDDEGIDLGKVESNFLCLSGDVLDAFAAIDFDYFVLIGIFKESEESADEAD